MLKKQLDYTGNPGSRSKKHCTAGEDICTNRKMQIGHGNDAGRIFGLSINEPGFQSVDNRVAAQMTIDFEVEIIQAEEQRCKIEISLEGAFLSEAEPIEDEFKQLVAINGAAAIIGLARGKLEAITANIFNNGKISIPFVNVLDYYRGQ